MLDIVCENVAFEWKQFAKLLGVSDRDIKKVEQTIPEAKEQCMQVIRIWKAGKSRSVITRELIQALRRARHVRVAGEFIVHSGDTT